MFARNDLRVMPTRVNGAAGVVVMAADQPVSVMGFTVVAGQVVAINVLSDPDRLQQIDLGAVY